MKHYWIWLFVMGSISLAAQPNLKKLEWIIGNWQRTNAKPGRSGVEIWKKISGTEFSGRGISLKGTDTAFVEKLKIIVKESDVFYVADVPENKGLVYFQLTASTAITLTFENTSHDFPKKIFYKVNGNKLKAIVSGDGKSIEYLFERKP